MIPKIMLVLNKRGYSIMRYLLAVSKYTQRTGITFTFLVLISYCCISPVADASTAEIEAEETTLERSNRFIQQSTLYKEQIAIMESEFGPFGPELLEPLQGYTNLLTEFEQFEEAGRILDRRLNLIRISDGPESVKQLPVLEENIVNDSRQERWQELVSSFSNILLIQENYPEADAIEVLNAMNDVRNLHLFLVFFDAPEKIGSHSLAIGDLQIKIRTFAEEYFDEQDPALVPWLYQDAIDQYRISRMGRRPQIEDSMNFGKQSLREGLRTVQKIRRIVESFDDPEAQAMAMIYEADFLMLAQRNSLGLELYSNAMDRLESSGIANKTIIEFFTRPVVLPAAKFHFTLRGALDEQASNGFSITSGGESNEESIHMGTYLAWSTAVPGVRFPTIPEPLLIPNLEVDPTRFQFTISPRNNLISISRLRIRPEFESGKFQETRDVTIDYLAPVPTHKISTCEMAELNLTDLPSSCNNF